MSFIGDIIAILVHQTRIVGLAVDDIAYWEKEEAGEEVRGKLSPHDKVRILRLQTLICKEEDRGLLFESNTPCEKNSAAIGIIMDDSEQRIIMLNQLITEIVREAIPSESDRFGMVYYISNDSKLYRHKAFQGEMD